MQEAYRDFLAELREDSPDARAGTISEMRSWWREQESAYIREALVHGGKGKQFMKEGVNEALALVSSPCCTQ